MVCCDINTGFWRRDGFIGSRCLKKYLARYQWFIPTILATWETELRRIVVQGHHRQIICETLPISKITREKWTGRVVEVVDACVASMKS
jgi:hypothetical protein